MFGRASSALQGHEGGLMSSSRMYLQFEKDGMVFVKNSYEEKDLLKAAGFRWNVENKCWTVIPHLDPYSPSSSRPMLTCAAGLIHDWFHWHCSRVE